MLVLQHSDAAGHFAAQARWVLALCGLLLCTGAPAILPSSKNCSFALFLEQTFGQSCKEPAKWQLGSTDGLHLTSHYTPFHLTYVKCCSVHALSASVTAIDHKECDSSALPTLTLKITMCYAEHKTLGHVGTSLVALQNPFMHTPIAGRIGHTQIEVPSSHKAPKLQVHLLSLPPLLTSSQGTSFQGYSIQKLDCGFTAQ